MENYVELCEFLGRHKNIVLTGAPGTGKTYLAGKMAEEMTKGNISLKPLEAISDYYKKNKKELDEKDGNNESLRRKFLELFPLETIDSITLDQYCLGYKKSDNNFCQWIEETLKPLGAFWPGVSSTFIIYRPKDQSRGDYINIGCISPEETIKELGKAIKEIGETGGFKAKSIGSTKMRNDYIIKIASSYNKNLYFPVCSRPHMEQICKIFDIKTNEEVFQMNKNILGYFKNKLPDLSSWVVMTIIYRLFYNDKKFSNPLSIEKKEALNTDSNFIRFTQFHPSYDYTDFVEGLRPIQGDDGEIKFELKNGIFKDFCKQASGFPQDVKFVMIIDEINRAELSKVFGELFYSIDPGYRGRDGKVKLQYSNLYKDTDLSSPEDYDPFKEGFYVPENVYIIATMNDIDRSIEPFDFAMKRRFAWREIKPDDTCEAMWKDELGNNIKEKARKKMKSLNDAIRNQFSSAYEIGGAYFLKLKDLDNDFEKLWEYYLESLIRDYLKGTHDAEAELIKFKNAYDLKKELSDDSPQG